MLQLDYCWYIIIPFPPRSLYNILVICAAPVRYWGIDCSYKDLSLFSWIFCCFNLGFQLSIITIVAGNSSVPSWGLGCHWRCLWGSYLAIIRWSLHELGWWFVKPREGCHGVLSLASCCFSYCAINWSLKFILSITFLIWLQTYFWGT